MLGSHENDFRTVTCFMLWFIRDARFSEASDDQIKKGKHEHLHICCWSNLREWRVSEGMQLDIFLLDNFIPFLQAKEWCLKRNPLTKKAPRAVFEPAVLDCWDEWSVAELLAILLRMYVNICIRIIRIYIIYFYREYRINSTTIHHPACWTSVRFLSVPFSKDAGCSAGWCSGHGTATAAMAGPVAANEFGTATWTFMTSAWCLNFQKHTRGQV